MAAEVTQVRKLGTGYSGMSACLSLSNDCPSLVAAVWRGSHYGIQAPKPDSEPHGLLLAMLSHPDQAVQCPAVLGPRATQAVLMGHQDPSDRAQLLSGVRMELRS